MNHSEIDFRYTMTFSQCVHGMYDEKMEAVYRKYSQNASFEENFKSTFYVMGGINMQIQLSEHFTFKKLLRFVLPSIVMMIFTSIYSIIKLKFTRKVQ